MYHHTVPWSASVDYGVYNTHYNYHYNLVRSVSSIKRFESSLHGWYWYIHLLLQGYLKVSIQITGPGEAPKDLAMKNQNVDEEDADIERYTIAYGGHPEMHCLVHYI